jgi:hypothetical protein
MVGRSSRHKSLPAFCASPSAEEGAADDKHAALRDREVAQLSPLGSGPITPRSAPCRRALLSRATHMCSETGIP